MSKRQRPKSSERTRVGFRSYQCNNPACPVRAWPDGTLRLFDESHFTCDGLCRLARLKVEAWPNGLGHDVYEEDVLVGEVLDDPIQVGLRVRTFDEDGEVERYLELPEKINPAEAVLRCRRDGQRYEKED
jgi:hypothetical protein